MNLSSMDEGWITVERQNSGRISKIEVGRKGWATLCSGMTMLELEWNFWSWVYELPFVFASGLVSSFHSRELTVEIVFPLILWLFHLISWEKGGYKTQIKLFLTGVTDGARGTKSASPEILPAIWKSPFFQSLTNISKEKSWYCLNPIENKLWSINQCFEAAQRKLLWS